MTPDKKEVVHFDAKLKSYLDRPLFDVHLNDVDIAWWSGTHTGNGTVMTGMAVSLGPQVPTWRPGAPERMRGNGDAV